MADVGRDCSIPLRPFSRASIGFNVPSLVEGFMEGSIAVARFQLQHPVVYAHGALVFVFPDKGESHLFQDLDVVTEVTCDIVQAVNLCVSKVNGVSVVKGDSSRSVSKEAEYPIPIYQIVPEQGTQETPIGTCQPG